MTREQTFVIVGASLAGAKAAETLRAEGFDGRVVLIGAEEARPYERPPLSKEYLRGEAGRDKVYVHDAGFYADHGIELQLGRMATGLDTCARELVFDDGARVGYDRLLLATGAEPRRLPVPGADLDGVVYLRTVEDSDSLRARLDRGGRVVVVGAGWIGAEVAASARTRGLDVTVLDPAAVPLERVLGTEVGAVYRDIHADRGVRMLLGTGVEAIVGGTSAEGVRTSDGTTSPATSWWSASACSRARGLRRRRGSPSTTGSWPMRTCARAPRACTQPVTWPTRSTPSTASASASSTGRPRSTRGLPPRATCSAARTPTSACRTSSPISTTSAWSTPASLAAGTASSSAVTRGAASSSPSGSPVASWWRE